MELLDNRERKASRQEIRIVDGQPEKTISDFQYNLTIGLVLAVGFLLDAVMATVFGNAIITFTYNYPIAVLIGYLVVSFGALFVIYKSTSPVVSFVAYLFLALAMGFLLTGYVAAYTAQSVTTAFIVTLLVTALMMVISMVFPGAFLKLGPVLLIALVACILIEVIMGFVLHMNLGFMDYIVALIFCGFIGFDWQRAQLNVKTYDNAVDSAADIYVDVVNLFIRILAILGNSRD